MIRNLNLMALCLGAAVTAFAADPNVPTTASSQPLSAQIASEARSANKLASNIAETLKQKNASLESVHESVSSIEKNIAEINRLVAELDGRRATMSAKQIAELDRMKTLSETMQVFVTNKKQFAEAGAENRQMVRSQAQAVRQRAEMIEKAALKIGG
jgi:prefoldin subunit 5